MTPHTTDGIQFPEYDKGSFIERSEAEAVRELVASLSVGRPSATRAVDFQGEPGVGKSWLLRHLAEVELRSDGPPTTHGNFLGDPDVGGSAGVHSLYLNLQDWTGTPDAVTKSLMIVMDEKVADWAKQPPTIRLGGVDSAPLSDLSRWLEADVRSLLQGATRALVLLLDHAHESSWALLRLLDQHVLGPLAALPKVFVVTAGRGKPYPWLAPDLRGHTQLETIKPFGVEQTRRQLQGQLGSRFSEDQAPEIHKLSGGYPRSNYAIGFFGLDRQREAIDGELQHLLEAVSDPKRREQLRECLEALCVLEGFRDDQIWPMLAGYYQDSAYTRRSLADASALLDEMRGYTFVHWDDASSPGAWKIYGRLRALLQGWVSGDKQLAVCMHCTAYALFSSWAKRYEKTRVRWQAKADYHQQALRAVGAETSDCTEVASSE